MPALQEYEYVPWNAQDDALSLPSLPPYIQREVGHCG